ASHCGVSPANPFPRESRSFPATPFDGYEKRTHIHEWSVFHNHYILVEKPFIASVRIQMAACLKV
ncbi:hypothetical protein, partial [Halobacillus trueperi]|uniref:hypothetical protein n=1 Tax=Halobacillus trueperi TaxID=156205 RepID=UPI001ABF9582